MQISSVGGMSGMYGSYSTASRQAPKAPDFSEIDTDGSGTVDKAEFTAFGEAMAAKGAPAVSSAQQEEMFSNFDSDGDGLISEDEHNAFAAQGPGGAGGAGGPGGAMQPPSFGDIDTDGSGGIDEDEFATFGATMEKNGAKALSDDERAELFSKIDTDGNGLISEEELSAGAPQGKGQMPPPPPPGGEQGAQGSTSDSTGIDLAALLEELQAEADEDESSTGSTQLAQLLQNMISKTYGTTAKADMTEELLSVNA